MKKYTILIIILLNLVFKGEVLFAQTPPPGPYGVDVTTLATYSPPQS
jgi:hypothetical protein